jgi:tricorn protease
MRRTIHVFLAVLALGLLSNSLPAQEPIQFARTPDISPDGKLVAFSYLGDIWVVETIGGKARQVTMHRAHEINPVFSPDGHSIAFSSNRHGSYNVFVIPVDSGKPRQLTFDSANDLVTGWSPDGQSVLFASTRSTAFPPGFELYTVPVDGGRARRVSAAEGREGVYSPKGDRIAYVRGPGAWYRKGYRGSANDDIWICDADGSNNRRLTTNDVQDTSPMWSSDGQWIYYVSECHGTPANIVRQAADAAVGPGAAAGALLPSGPKPQPVTHHTDDAVRRARISGNGQWIVYECGADLWVVSTKEGATPRKLAIEVHTDDKSNADRVETYANDHASEFALSADEKYAVLTIHGELFLTQIAPPSGKTRRLTETNVNNHGVAWAPDNSRILFISDKSGHDNIYMLQADDPEHPQFVNARRFKTTQLTKSKEAALGVSFSPDGKRVAFVQAGKLWTMNPDGTDQKTVVNETRVIDYEWSPDSKWFVYSRQDGSFASELYVVPVTGPTAENPPRNITRYATLNTEVSWSADGKKIAFLSARGASNIPTLYVTTLRKPAAPGVAEGPAGSGAVEIDWDDIHLRAERVRSVPASLAVEEAAISPDGSKIAFRSRGQPREAGDLWVANTDGSQLTRLTTGNVGPFQIQWSKRKSGLGPPVEAIYFRDAKGGVRLVRVAGEPKPENVATLPFKAKINVRTDEEFTEMFDQSWRYLAENFYDNKFHGSDWDAVRAKYRPLVKHVTMKEDLYTLLYLMMGELNASHLGVGGPPGTPEEPTADVGLIFDETYRGKGLKIAEVLKRGPADRRGLNLKPGEYVVAIDGVEIADTTDVSKLLNDKVGEGVELQVTADPNADPKDPKARRKVEVVGADRDKTIRPLMYDRWVEKNAQKVAELSKGKLGYIHIPSMDEAGLDHFVRALYSDNFDKEAIVLDVRFNGGGFTHDQVLTYLGAHEHTLFRQRDGGDGVVLRPGDRKWTKPLVLLINNRSYSDAEIFPNAFRALNLGKLVGQPTGGHVIGTTSVRLIDGSVLRLPHIGVYTAKGVNMDKQGVTPDVAVETPPDLLAKGVDLQLEKAVEVLQADVAEAKKKADPPAATAPGEEGKTGLPK